MSTERRVSKPQTQTAYKFNFQSKIGTIEDYELGDMLGKGAYGEVFQAKDKNSGELVAIKIYDKYQMNQAHRLKSISSEIKILKKLDHPNLIKLHSVHETVTKIYLVMDLVKGVCLEEYLKDKRKLR